MMFPKCVSQLAIALVLVLAAGISGSRADALPCGRDCDNSGDVTVNEIQALINLALHGGTSGCAPADSDRNGRITVDEILVVVQSALSNC